MSTQPDLKLSAEVEEAILWLTPALHEVARKVLLIEDPDLRHRMSDELDHALGRHMSPRLSLLVAAGLRSSATSEQLIAAVVSAH